MSVDPAGAARQCGQHCRCRADAGSERSNGSVAMRQPQREAGVGPTVWPYAWEAYLNVVDVHSGAVWASTSPVGVDGELHAAAVATGGARLHWHTAVSDGGRAIREAVATVTPDCPHQRDVWHLLHACQQVQARLYRLVEGLQQRTAVVARQAARVAAGKRPRGKCPKSDVKAHAAELAQAQYACQVCATCRVNCATCWAWWC